MNPDLADLYANYAAAARDRWAREAATPWVLFFYEDGTPFLYIGTAGEPMLKTVTDGAHAAFERTGRLPENAEVTAANYIRMHDETPNLVGMMGRSLRLHTAYGLVKVACRSEPGGGS